MESLDIERSKEDALNNAAKFVANNLQVNENEVRTRPSEANLVW